VIFSTDNNPMKFMDSIITPFAPDVTKPRVPSYLLFHNDHYTVLSHREQKEVSSYYVKNGSELRPFKARLFELRKDEFMDL
jgi:hypothetical protein